MRIWITPLIAVSGCALVFLAIPMVAWAIHWQWRPDTQLDCLRLFYFFTQTVTRPYGILTSIILLAAIMMTLKEERRQLPRLCFILIFPVFIGQLTIGELKKVTHEPRPYVVWLSKQHPQQMQEFYNLAPAERSKVISRTLSDNSPVPVWQEQHWQSQTDYAFPSGHTVFAGTWALMAVGVMATRRRILLPALIVMWAAGVITSRLLLGVHWPGDLVASLIIALCLSLPALYFLLRQKPRARPAL